MEELFVESFGDADTAIRHAQLDLGLAARRRPHPEAPLERLTVGETTIEALRAHFEAIYEDCISPMGHRGCMLINCALELAHHDRQAQAIVKKGLAHHEKILRDLIRAGQKAAEINPELDSDATPSL